MDKNKFYARLRVVYMNGKKRSREEDEEEEGDRKTYILGEIQSILRDNQIEWSDFGSYLEATVGEYTFYLGTSSRKDYSVLEDSSYPKQIVKIGYTHTRRGLGCIDSTSGAQRVHRPGL